MSTIRDPQMDIATADYTIGGTWEYNNKMSYTSHPAITADTDIADKRYVDEQIVGGVNQDNVYYVGKHGNDSTGDGLNIEHAFLTLQKGIDEADTQSPTVSSQYVVKVEDGGSYDSFTLASKPYIHIEAEGTQLESSSGTYIFSTNNSLTVDKIIAGGGFASGTLVNYNGSGDGYLKANEISGAAVTRALYTQAAGTCYATVDQINISTSNTAVDVGPDSELHLTSKFIKGKIDIGGDGYANIITDQLDGDIIVSGTGILYIVINGNFVGDITVDEDSRVRILVGTRSGSYTDTIDPSADYGITYIGQHDVLPHRNVLIGSDYIVNPRQEVPSGLHPGAAIDTYVADNTVFSARFGGTIDMSIGANNNLASTYAAGVQERWGFIIHVESKDSLPLIGGVASISFRAAWTAGPRSGTFLDGGAALLAWDGTADAQDSDPISSWTTSPPTLKSNWTYEAYNTTFDLDKTGVYKTFKLENISVDTVGAKNLAVFVWSSDPINQIGNTLEISNIRLNSGPLAEDFSPRSAVEEYILCQRYYQKSYSSGDPRGTVTRAGSQSVDKGAGGTNPYVGMNVRFSYPMLKVPTLVPYSTSTGTAGQIHLEGIGDSVAESTALGDSGGQIKQTTPSVGEYHASYQWIADARF